MSKPTYFEDLDDGDVTAVFLDERGPTGHYRGIGTVLAGRPDTLTEVAVSDFYLTRDCREVPWDDVPAEWREAFDKLSEAGHAA